MGKIDKIQDIKIGPVMVTKIKVTKTVVVNIKITSKIWVSRTHDMQENTLVIRDEVVHVAAMRVIIYENARTKNTTATLVAISVIGLDTTSSIVFALEKPFRAFHKKAFLLTRRIQ